MPYFVNVDEGPLASPGDIQPSFGLSLKSAVGDATTGNISSVLMDYAELQNKNDGPRLSRQESERLVSEAGVKLQIPESGYTKGALDLLVRRKRDEMTRQQVADATPWSWLGTPIRGGAMLLATVADPLNVASAFIPVVREARAASLIARAGQGAFARAGTRAAIGAADGLVGAALVEVPTYALRTAMQDDYSLTDSLLNMAFGTVAGGGLHSVGGAVGDALRGGGNPYAASQRRTAGLANDSPVVEVQAGAVEQAVQSAVRPDLAKVADAPFAKLYEVDQKGASARALEEMKDELRAELLPVAAGRAEPRVVAELREQQRGLVERRELLESDAEFKRRAKEAQAGGMSRKQAESAARKSLAGELADVTASEQRIAQSLDSNTKASQAEQQIAGLERGEISEQFAGRVDARAGEIMGAAEMARAVTGVKEPPAAFVIGMASPETREALMRTALAQMASGRLPDIEAVLRTDPNVIGARTTALDVQRAAQRQASPDSAALGDPAAADAASKRQKEAASAFGEKAVGDELALATKQLQDLQRNLEAGGMAAADVEKLADLSSFADAVKQADAIGKALEAAALCGVRQ
jgi:hypothetical protein